VALDVASLTQSIDEMWALKEREIRRMYVDDTTKTLILERARDFYRNVVNAIQLQHQAETGQPVPRQLPQANNPAS